MRKRGVREKVSMNDVMVGWDRERERERERARQRTTDENLYS